MTKTSNQDKTTSAVGLEVGANSTVNIKGNVDVHAGAKERLPRKKPPQRNIQTPSLHIDGSHNNIYLGDRHQTIAEPAVSDNARLKRTSRDKSKSANGMRSGGQKRKASGEKDTIAKVGRKESEVEDPIKLNADRAPKQKNRTSDGEGTSQKIPKNEPAHLLEADPVKIYLAAENAEILLKKNKFSEAQTELMRVGRTGVADFRFKLLLAECKLRLGLEEDTKRAISDVAEFIEANSVVTKEDAFNYGSSWIEKHRLGKAMILLASYASVLAKKSNPGDINQTVSDIATSIKIFSDAVRKIPDSKRKQRTNAAKKKPTHPPLKKTIRRLVRVVERVQSNYGRHARKITFARWHQ